MQQESPAISKLRTLINDCTEEEAEAIFPIVESAINMARNNAKRDV